MASIGKLYGTPGTPKVMRVMAAAKINGLELELVTTKPGKTPTSRSFWPSSLRARCLHLKARMGSC